MPCIFRLHGDFIWPPAVKPASNDGDTRRGLVEIHFEQAAGGNPGWVAFLRWRPGDAAASGAPPLPLENIFALTDASAWFDQHADQDASVWIHRRGTHDGGERAAFRGAFLFTQFEYGDAGDVQVLRWPLLRSCAYARNEPQVFSELLIGQPESKGKPNDSFRFNLHVPTPFKQTALKDIAVSALPFSALFSPTVSRLQDATSLSTMVGGPVGTDIVRASFTFKPETTGGKRLGAFGLAARGTKAMSDFVQYADNTHGGVILPPSVDLKRFWAPLRSEQAAQACLKLLEHIGIRVEPTTSIKVDDSDPAAISVRLPQPAPLASLDESHAWTLKYRLTFVAKTKDGEAGDLVWRGGRFALDLQEEIGGYLATRSERLHLDCEVSWTIGDDEAWTREWEPQTTMRLHWQEEVPAGPLAAMPALGFGPRKLPVFSVGTLGAAANALGGAPKSLYQVESAQPQSFLPELHSLQAQKVRLALYAPSVGLVPGSLLEWPTAPPITRETRLRLSLPDAKKHLLPGQWEPPRPFLLEACLHSFFYGKSIPALRLLLEHDSAAIPATWDAAATGEGYFAWFVFHVVKSGAWHGRLSSLAFESLGSGVVDAAPGAIQSGGRGVGSHALRFVRPTGEYPIPIAAQLTLQLPFSQVTALGPDTGRGDDERVTPLLVPLSANVPPGSDAKFHLMIRESVAPFADRRLDVDLVENQDEKGELGYVVISDEPFAISRFSHKPLGARGDASRGIVATYSSLRRVWEYVSVQEHYRFLLPPQSVGESADKPRRLELHDWLGLPEKDDPGDPGTPGSVPRPYRVRRDAVGAAVVDSFQRRAVEFRLTPSAEIWVRPSDVARGYFMPEWQSHEIFRQRGELGLGVALSALRAEFLYGMPVGVEMAMEKGPARRARVTEIESLTGSLLPIARGKSTPEARWNKLRPAILRRPERLEVWAHDPDAVVEFAPARFSTGVNFALRRTALLRAPLPSLDGPGAQGVPADPDRAPPVITASFRYHPQGLSGGALWPVESANLFRALADNPQSSGGTLEGLALSPLGGDAAQKANFLGGKVAIISQTRNGFIESQRVEVIGRVGALWHRAKHVVVYERTVNPSAQFAPLFEEDSQRTRSRRPILRKVREFIEILEHERAYPDFPQATARSTGFLERVRFNSRLINVDSAWSRDVENFGWEIPLWNRAAARRRPEVYPMPDAAFCCHSEGEGDTPTVAQECGDCDYLFFFADFETPGNDTNAWPARLGIDYVNVPAASTIASVVDGASSRDPAELDGAAGRRPPVSRILPGMRRFTWRLASAARKVAINAGRAASPLYVALDSVSFMRAGATPDAEKEFTERLKPFLDFSAKAAAAAGAAGDLGYWAGDGSGTDSAVKKAFSNKVQAVRAADSPEKMQVALSDLKNWWAGTDVAVAFADLEAPLKEAKKLFESIPDPTELLSRGMAQCDQLRIDALGLLHGKAMLVEALVRDWEASIRLDYAALPTEAVLIEDLTKELVKAARPAFDAATGTVANAREGVETARAILADLRAEADAALAGALTRIEDYRTSYDQSKPWSPARRKEFHDGLFATASALENDIASHIDEARQRLAIELNDVSQQLGGIVARSLRSIDAAQRDQIRRVRSFEAALATILKEARGKINSAPFAAAKTRLEEIRLKIEAAALTPENRAKLLDLLAPAEVSAGALITAGTKAREFVEEIGRLSAEYDDIAVSGMKGVGTSLKDLLGMGQTQAQQLLDLLQEAGDQALTDIAAQVQAVQQTFVDWLADVDAIAQKYLNIVGRPVDIFVAEFIREARAAIVHLRGELESAGTTLDTVAVDIGEAMKAAENALAPGALMDSVMKDRVIRPALERLLEPLPATLETGQLDEVRVRLASVSAAIGDATRKLDATAMSAVDQITDLCASVFDGTDSIYRYAKQLEGEANDYIKARIDRCGEYFEDLQVTKENMDRVLAAVSAADQTLRRIQNDLIRSVEGVHAYGDRVLDAAGRLGSGGLMAAPGNVLRLYSAVCSAPELAALKADIDRLRASFDELSDIVGTTRVTALFNRLGDELKALGLSFPFDGIGERLLPADLSSLDIGKVFRSLGGAKLEQLFKGCKLPRGVADAIVLTHEFNAKSGRAWVQIDINAPMPGRRSLFSVEVFKADFVDMKITAQLRFDVTAEDPNVTQTGFGRIGTTIDMAVAGQSMVSFEKFGLSFTREAGLQVEFDPKNIRINPSLQFVQDFLSMLFPDEIGGMRVIKRDGIPVGLEHEFAMPPISINFATSGISNIAISNTFQLTAYPDFVLSDNFWLSKPEQPFIFSFFIIGGTGYVHVEAEYRPFQSELTVTVEAGAGGSAAIGFSFGPFSGQIFITLSVAISYRKRIGESGGLLSIGAVLVIAGYVNVASIATVGIYLLLRMTYRDSGQVDADGTLSVTIRISRFFKITARANVQYRLRDGRSETQSSGGVDVEPEAEIAEKVKRLQKARG